MTTLTHDRPQRKTATPFESTPWCYRGDGVVDYTEHVTSTAALTVGVRLSTPAFASVIDAHLTLLMNVGSALSVKLGIGSFDTDGVSPILPVQATLDVQNARITGSSSGIASSGSTLLLDGITLLQLIPKRGDPTFSEDGFVLVMQFSRLRTSSDTLRRFDMQMSADLGII